MKEILKKYAGMEKLLAAAVMAVMLIFCQKAISAEASASGVARYSVKVTEGYLALRSAQAYDAANEIAKLYTGDNVIYINSGSGGDYYYVYSMDRGKLGYVNKNYLVYEGLMEKGFAEVKVESGYLALRSAKSYDASNEIASMNNGESVYVLNDSDSSYWLVYYPRLEMAGYANCDYLVTDGNDNSGNSYYSDSSVKGISAGLVCDMDVMVFSTNCLIFSIPDSWADGIYFDYNESRIEFYCQAVRDASGMEDGFLCRISRTTGSAPEGSVTYLGSSEGYKYYLEKPTDVRANRNDADSYEIYQDMFSDVSGLAGEILLF